MVERFILVRTSRPQEVNAYLYSHTVVDTSVTLSEGRLDNSDAVAVILATTAHTAPEADYLANYQAGRLDSGMHWSSVWPRRDRAVEELISSV